MNTLDHEVITKITEELNGLEKNTINGWNVVYPTLYTTLNTIIEELCNTLHCSVPGLFIDFQGVQRYQASAQLMTDGTAQLHLGADFIRKFLLNSDSAENSTTLYRAFRWTIAHELSHLVDPKFKLFARSHTVRLVLDRIAFIWCLFGMISLMPGSSFGSANLTSLLIISTTFIVLKKMFITLLHRRFEYSADEMSVCIDEFNPHDAQTALNGMTSAVRNALKNPYEHSTNRLMQFLGRCSKTLTAIRIFHLHPPISNRIARMHTVYKKRQTNQH